MFAKRLIRYRRPGTENPDGLINRRCYARSGRSLMQEDDEWVMADRRYFGAGNANAMAYEPLMGSDQAFLEFLDHYRFPRVVVPGHDLL